jgi:alginate O-acetyltransferase complex protein AlgJ
MKSYRNKFLVWLTLSLSVFALLPLVNLYHQKPRWQFATLKTDVDNLFSMDKVQGWFNYGLYRLGISGNLADVVVGKQGWLFLGNAHSNIVNKMRGVPLPETREAYILSYINTMLNIQTRLAERGIPMLFVIAPNKYSIYPEYAPAWLEIAAVNSTDVFVHEAARLGLNILDLRPLLRAAKAEQPIPLYYSTDTHWNRYGAAHAYQEIMTALNRIHGFQFKTVAPLRYIPVPRGGGDLAYLNKISWILSGSHDQDFTLDFPGHDDLVCIKQINSETDIDISDCPLRRNLPQDVASKNLLVHNPHALNPHRLLWIRDSFGNDPSHLFQTSFQYTWQGDYYRFYNEQALLTAAELTRPDVVVYQIVERHILHAHLFPPL